MANFGQIDDGTVIALAGARLHLESHEAVTRERGGSDPDEK